jgi:hypothetical protein
MMLIRVGFGRAGISVSLEMLLLAAVVYGGEQLGLLRHSVVMSDSYKLWCCSNADSNSGELPTDSTHP